LRTWRSLSIKPAPIFRKAKSIGSADTLQLGLPDVRAWVSGRLPLFRKPDKPRPRSFASIRQFKSELLLFSHRVRLRHRHHLREFVTEDTPPLGAPNPELEQIAGPQKIMLAVAALGAAVFISAMLWLLAMR
jgi:hypothetical protein